MKLTPEEKTLMTQVMNQTKMQITAQLAQLEQIKKRAADFRTLETEFAGMTEDGEVELSPPVKETLFGLLKHMRYHEVESIVDKLKLKPK